jgi:hypothetical protein
MIRLEGRGASYGEIWYDEEPPARGVDILLYRQRAAPVANAQVTPTTLLLTDLSVDADAIVAPFDNTCRYHIRRADKKDGLAFEVVEQPETRLHELRDFYRAFAREKSVWDIDMPWLVAACRSDQLALTIASHDGEPLVWHAHVIYGVTAGMQYSCSCFRERDNEYRARIARANRWLHWQDMLRFKSRGCTRYDWGGVFSDESTPERAGINNFKRSFGPTPLTTYDCTAPVTLRGRVWLSIRDAWRKRRAPQLAERVAAAA